MNLGNNLQLLIFLGFMGLSAASWIFGQLKEQARIKRAKDEARRRYEEQLRTGRAPEAPSALATTERDSGPAEALADRRQAQLQELRRRQAQQQQAGARVAGGVILTRAPGGTVGRGGPAPGGVVIQRVPSGAPAPARRGPGQLRAPQQGPGTMPDPRVQTQRNRQAEQAHREIGVRQSETAHAEAQKALVRQQEARRAAGPSPVARVASRSERVMSIRSLFFDAEGRALSRAQLLRVIAATEVFGRPRSERELGEGL